MAFHLLMVRCVRILLVYRAPGLSTSLLLEEFSKLLEHITADLRHKGLLIVGDFKYPCRQLKRCNRQTISGLAGLLRCGTVCQRENRC